MQFFNGLLAGQLGGFLARDELDVPARLFPIGRRASQDFQRWHLRGFAAEQLLGDLDSNPLADVL